MHGRKNIKLNITGNAVDVTRIMILAGSGWVPETSIYEGSELEDGEGFIFTQVFHNFPTQTVV